MERVSRRLGAPQTFDAKMQLLRLAWALTGAAICCFLILLIHSRLLKEGNPAHTLLPLRAPSHSSAEVSPSRHPWARVDFFFFFFFLVSVQHFQAAGLEVRCIRTMRAGGGSDRSLLSRV